MRKFSLFLLMVIFTSSVLVSSLFAQTVQHKKAVVATEIVDGSIISVDKIKKEIIVKDEKTGQDRTFIVSEKAILVVKTGEEVKVKVKLGSNVAENVRVVNQKPKTVKK